MRNSTEVQLKSGAVSFGGLLGIGVSSAATAMSFAGTLMIIVGLGGYAVPLSFIIATVLMVLTGVSFGEVNKLFPSAGGFYAFMRESTNVYLAWWSTWLYYLVIPIGGSTVAVVGVIYLHALTGVPYWILAGAVCLFGFLVNWRGISLATITMMAIWVLQVVSLGIVGFIIFRWASVSEPEFSLNLSRMWVPHASIGLNGILAASFACIYAFCGFENPTTLGEETKNAARKVSWAVVLAPLVTGLVCTLLGVLWMSAVPTSLLPEIATSTEPLNVILSYAGLSNYIPFVTVIVAISGIGCIVGWWAAMTRIWYDKARAGSFPKALTRLNKHQIPSVGMVVISIITFVCMMLETYGNMYEMFVLLVSYGAVTTYGLIHVANICANRKRRGFRAMVCNKIIPVFGIIVMVYVFIIQPPQSLVSGSIWGVIGLIVMYAIFKAKGRSAFVMSDPEDEKGKESRAAQS